MTAEKQHKMYGVLMFVVVLLLLAAQYVLQYTLQQASEQLVSIRTSLSSEHSMLNSQRSLSERFKSFEILASNQGGSDRQFPENPREFFTALGNVMSDYSISFSSSSTNLTVKPGENFTLSISLNGQYYNVMKALAAIRESNYIMRINELRLSAEGGGSIQGTMNIVSTAQN
ncbi:MAG: hypothetical protein LBK91_02265 [Synergistaceae bacterium]|nr:hypothetical protein [Synergistaceae bacterium]